MLLLIAFIYYAAAMSKVLCRALCLPFLIITIIPQESSNSCYKIRAQRGTVTCQKYNYSKFVKSGFKSDGLTPYPILPTAQCFLVNLQTMT